MIYILLIAMLYSNGFDKAETGKVPEDLMVLEGGFAVQEESGNKFLELPGSPLETFGLLVVHVVDYCDLDVLDCRVRIGPRERS